MHGWMYYRQPYTRSFPGCVTECVPAEDGRFWVFLEDTAFYPEGGGQPGDTGTLLVQGETIPVLDTQVRQGRPAHLTEAFFSPGTQVQGHIDWDKRFRRMQNHTGEHILSGVLTKRCGVQNTGFHMGRDGVQVDFDRELSPEELRSAEKEVNQCVFANVPVESVIYDEKNLPKNPYRCKKVLSGPVRLVTVPEYDCCACCGLHVARTGEIGMVRLLRWERYKGGTRIWMVSGWDAFQVFHTHSSHVYAISALLSAKELEITAAVERLKAENEKHKQEVYRWRKAAFQEKANQMDEQKDRVVAVEDNLTAEECRQLAAVLLAGHKEALVFSPQGDGQLLSCAISSSADTARQFWEYIKERFPVKGGGKPSFVQGTVTGNLSAVLAYVKTLK